MLFVIYPRQVSIEDIIEGLEDLYAPSSLSIVICVSSSMRSWNELHIWSYVLCDIVAALR